MFLCLAHAHPITYNPVGLSDNGSPGILTGPLFRLPPIQIGKTFHFFIQLQVLSLAVYS